MTHRRRAAWQPRRAADARHLAQAAVYALLATPVLGAALLLAAWLALRAAA